jgi:hypothetical protein
MSRKLDLPHQWKARDYQEPLWRYMHGGGKRAIAIWPRRHGKDDLALHFTACAAHERVGTYWHLLPQQNQARKAIWNAVNPHTGRRRIDDAFPAELRDATRDDEMFIRFKTGSTWQVIGSDNYDALGGHAAHRGGVLGVGAERSASLVADPPDPLGERRLVDLHHHAARPQPRAPHVRDGQGLGGVVRRAADG